MREGLNHLADALTRDVLKRAGFEDLHHGIFNVGLFSLHIATDRIHNRFGAFHDGVSGFFRGLYNQVQLHPRSGNMVTFKVNGLQRRNFNACVLNVVGQVPKFVKDG